MITEHQYLNKYPIPKSSKKLIVGTIHPHNHKEFEVDFFYGNKNSIWTILHDAFPNQISKPITLEGIINFLNKNDIGISDTIKICKRTNPFALDEDLIPTHLNYEIIDQIKRSQISEIFFTSGFGKNNAFKLFYVDILKQKITSDIKKNREIILDSSFFNRPIKLTVLYSPSGTANVGLSKSKSYASVKHLYQNLNTPVQKFKIDYYKSKFKL